MAKKLKRIFTILIMLNMILSISCPCAYADDNEQTTTTDADSVYEYYYNGYDVNVSPHFMKNGENGSGEWTMIFRLDKQNYFENGSYSYNEIDRVKDGFAAYCSDVETNLQKRTAYKCINLEDSTYYSKDMAAKIRGIFKYGYWPGENWSASDAENTANSWLKEKYPGDNDKRINNLTNAEALSATQGAIWSCANNSGKSAFRYAYTRSDEEFISSCETTTCNKEEVIYSEEKKTDADTGKNITENNINLFVEFLLAQESKAPEKILFSDKYLVSSQAVFSAAEATGEAETVYTVTVRFKLSGSIGSNDNLTLCGTIGDNTVKMPLTGNNAIQPDENGYYVITFENVTGVNENTQINMSVSGTQQVDDVYFYQSKPQNGTNERKTSQNLVGKIKGETKVYAQQSIDLTLGTAEAELNKYDSGNESNKLSGAIFNLYAKVYTDKETQKYNYVLVKKDLKTDSDGKIKVTGLAEGYDYYFKETKAPAGFVCDDAYHKVETGTVNVGNKYDTGGLTLSKTVKYKASDEHFTFQITLDLNKADLTNASEVFGNSSFNAEWSNIEDDSEFHGSVDFVESESVLTAQVQLKDGESLSIRGIPAGTAYTVTEIDSKGYYVRSNNDYGKIPSGSDINVTFINSKFNVNGSAITSARWSLTGTKTFDGQPAAGYTFRMLDRNGNEIAIVQSDKNGIIAFPEQTYTSAGIYTYEISEVQDNAEGVIYDDVVYMVQVTVTQNGSRLDTTVEIFNDGVKVDSVTFENKTDKSVDNEDKDDSGNSGQSEADSSTSEGDTDNDKTDSEISGNGTNTDKMDSNIDESVKTGDITDCVSWMFVLLISTALIILICRKRRNE